MPMRRAVTASVTHQVDLASCGFTPVEIATLDHSTLPWFGRPPAPRLEIGGVGLEKVRGWGRRDRLSLLAQMAGHLAMLRFSGVPWGGFVPEEWIALRKRGEECRLVRLGRGAGGEESAGSILSRAAEVLGLEPPEALRASWVKPDLVYAAVDREIGGPPMAVCWRRRAAMGWLRAPGRVPLERLMEGASVRLGGGDASVARGVARFCAAAGSPFRAIVLGGERTTPVKPFSAVQALRELAVIEQGREADACEAIDRALGESRALFVVVTPERFDPSSIHLVRLLASGRRDLSWIVSGEVPPMLASAGPFEIVPASLPFLVSPRLEGLKELRELVGRLSEERREGWLQQVAGSPELDRFLGGSPLPMPADEIAIEEPRRSLLAALAAIGRRIEIPLARRILQELGWNMPVEHLGCEGVVEVKEGAVVFVDALMHRSLERLLPAESAGALCSVAAVAAGEDDAWRSALLSLRGGELDRAVEALNDAGELTEEERRELMEVLGSVPAGLLARSRAASVYGHLLLRAGRYLQAREVAALVPEPEARHLRARAERRLGRYDVALRELEGAEDAESLLLRAELERLSGRLARAWELIRRIDEATLPASLRDRFAWESAVLAIDSGEAVSARSLRALGFAPYLRARLATYLALRTGRYPTARTEAARAVELSSDLPERIDAALDLLFTLFLSGDWRHARLQAREALALTEETEGDRAAGGVLFTLAYLCADAGEWSRAEELIERLRAFYTHTADERRLREIALIAAHLALCRGALAEARAHASGIDPNELTAEEREARSLVLDEADAMEGIDAPLRSTGASACRELRDRHLLLRAQADPTVASGIANPFLRALARWQGSLLAGERQEPPPPADSAEGLLLLRRMVALSHRVPFLRERAAALGAELGVPLGLLTAQTPSGGRELTILQRVAALPFPFAPGDLPGVRWLFARRNRLGVWTQIGCLPERDPLELDARLETPGTDWVRCGEHALLHVEGLEGWSDGSRTSLAALFLMRSEHHALKRALEQEAMTIADQPAREVAGILGSAPAIRELLATVARIAPREVPVCIEGESGTGKELIARAIHAGSARRSRPFLALNCAALPETLIESELFGHVRGAFTGADRDKPGLIEAADGGTLFLDEIGELPLAAQAKLLRFLQEGEIRRLGEAATRKADVRVVAATNRRLETEVDEGRFREDLYYRIRGIELRVPPLRERGSDVLLLARAFLDRENRKERTAVRFSEEVEAALLAYGWPGNVRELEQTVRSAVALAGGGRVIELEHLPPRVRAAHRPRRAAGSFYDEVNRFRRMLVERSLAEAGGNQSEAARLLGISRQALAYQIRELGIAVRKEKRAR